MQHKDLHRSVLWRFHNLRKGLGVSQVMEQIPSLSVGRTLLFNFECDGLVSNGKLGAVIRSWKNYLIGRM